MCRGGRRRAGTEMRSRTIVARASRGPPTHNPRQAKPRLTWRTAVIYIFFICFVHCAYYTRCSRATRNKVRVESFHINGRNAAQSGFHLTRNPSTEGHRRRQWHHRWNLTSSSTGFSSRMIPPLGGILSTKMLFYPKRCNSYCAGRDLMPHVLHHAG